MQVTGNDINQKMQQADVSITDETINYNQSEDYTLFIQLGYDGCTYALFDKERNSFVSLHNFPFYHLHPQEKVHQRIKNILDEGPVISTGNFTEVVISIINNISTIIPEAILEEGNEEAVLSLNHNLENNGKIYSDTINSIDALNIYTMPPALESIIKFKFPDAEIIHFSTPLIESLIVNNKHKEDKQVIIHIRPTHFEVVVTQGKSLLFYNSFHYKAPEDVIYYILNVFEQLQLNPESIPVNLIGEIEKRSGIYSLLVKYIRFVNFGKRPDHVHFSYKFHELPEHYYYSLFSLVICV